MRTQVAALERREPARPMDKPGIVFSVARFLFEHSCTIVESHQFNDSDAGRFYMRVEFEPFLDDVVDAETLQRDFVSLAAEASMSWQVWPKSRRQRVLIMVSKYGHCLNDLLFRRSVGDLRIDVPAVVSNHADLAPIADHFEIPLHHLPVTTETKKDAEVRLLTLVEELNVDLVVLARYMQILSPEMCRELDARPINIHHSILPSFKGARPYHQAYRRGVKLVGATAHYVTADLDEGPIIEQEVARVDHAMSAEAVTALGRDTECLALSRAVRWHTEGRVLLDGIKTVVFR